jgi:hypothetical protein
MVRVRITTLNIKRETIDIALCETVWMHGLNDRPGQVEALQIDGMRPLKRTLSRGHGRAAHYYFGLAARIAVRARNARNRGQPNCMEH